MIDFSKAKSKILKGNTPANLADIEMQEICDICKKSIKKGTTVFRHDISDAIVCVDCAFEIADRV